MRPKLRAFRGRTKNTAIKLTAFRGWVEDVLIALVKPPSEVISTINPAPMNVFAYAGIPKTMSVYTNIPEVDMHGVVVAHGFIGTIEEWLVSLEGSTGPTGLFGSTGPTGTTGKSMEIY